MLRHIITAGFLTLAAPVWGQGVFSFPEDENEANYIANEVIATFYHEVAHALIDVLDIPVLGKEEDAADALSVILMDWIWEEEAAAAILSSNAMTYAIRADVPLEEVEPSTFADTHSLDIQRYYAVVCLFYGANPEARRDLAVELDLPEEKLESCPYDYEATAGAWETALQGSEPSAETVGFVMGPGQEGLPLADLLAEEVASLNQMIGLPQEVTVWVEDCGEANAFYYPDETKIVLCNEYAEELRELWAAAQ